MNKINKDFSNIRMKIQELHKKKRKKNYRWLDKVKWWHNSVLKTGQDEEEKNKTGV